MKLNILILGSGGNAARNYVNSLKLEKKMIGKTVGIDIDENGRYFSNTDKFYKIDKKLKIESKTEFINNIIKKETIDFIHAQPDKEVEYISKISKYLKANFIQIDKKALKIYQNKDLTNTIWGDKFSNFISYSYIEVLKNEELFKYCIEKNGKAWVRKKQGAGSSGALPVKNIKQLKNWVNYWVEYRNAKPEEFIVSEYLNGQEFAVQILFWHGKLIHLQARERVEYFFANQMISGQSSTPSISRTINNFELQNCAIDSIKTIEKEPHGIYCVDIKQNNEKNYVPMEVNYGRLFTTNYFFSQLGVNTPVDSIKKQFNLKVEKKINHIKEDIYCYRGLDMEMKVVD